MQKFGVVTLDKSGTCIVDIRQGVWPRCNYRVEGKVQSVGTTARPFSDVNLATKILYCGLFVSFLQMSDTSDYTSTNCRALKRMDRLCSSSPATVLCFNKQWPPLESDIISV